MCVSEEMNKSVNDNHKDGIFIILQDYSPKGYISCSLTENEGYFHNQTISISPRLSRMS